MKIATRIRLASSILFLLVAALSIEAAWLALRGQKRVEQVGEELTQLSLLVDLELFAQREVAEVSDFVGGRDPKAETQFASFADRVRGLLARCRSLPRGESEKEGLAAVEQNALQLERMGWEILERSTRSSGPTPFSGVDSLEAFLDGPFRQSVRALERVFHEGAIERARNQARRLKETATLLVALCFLAGLGLASLVSLWLSQGIGRPLRNLVEAARKIGRGDLDADPEVPPSGDLRELALAFRQMASELRASQEKIVQAERMASIGTTAAAVAHGIRNPLASIRALAQVGLLQPTPSPSAKETLREIIVETDRLDRRIGQLLSFAKPLSPRPILGNLNGLVEAIVPSLAKGEGKEVAIDLFLDTDLAPTRFDPAQMEQVLLELLANALAAVGPRGRIQLRTGLRSDRWVFLEIEDDGEGILEENLQRVTEPFFTTRPEGSGLGLAIVQRYVSQNGGELRVSSSFGKGTRVTLLFPSASLGSDGT
ncbi:two-component system, NtrC family, sensor histidine kinase AtoS [Methylacidimicrobium cyclopophantes]|uniref:histidine kinase n=1 Tax=Methylacidimicrobium cyclopophantes TaxID=1041766 RepID=A0A5E6MGY7_9BACT|nr:ATP-binding protein [Methylacidimicrobium cyclopophantes]VVM08554.1 two-component system, NtrC family, sensor histidine kinase AtoS [Methylacidimicrobium cyclopophantes]